MHVYADHNDEVTSPETLARNIKRMTPRVKKWLQDYRSKSPDYKVSHLVMTGISGQSVGWPLSAALKLPAVVIRKASEKAHSGLIVGQGDVRDYILIDDFISTGATVDRVVSALLQEHFRQPLCRNVWPATPETDKAATAPICRAIFAHRQGYTTGLSSFFLAVDNNGPISHDYRPRILREDSPAVPADFVHPSIPVIGPTDYVK